MNIEAWQFEIDEFKFTLLAPGEPDPRRGQKYWTIRVEGTGNDHLAEIGHRYPEDQSAQNTGSSFASGLYHDITSSWVDEHHKEITERVAGIIDNYNAEHTSKEETSGAAS